MTSHSLSLRYPSRSDTSPDVQPSPFSHRRRSNPSGPRSCVSTRSRVAALIELQEWVTVTMAPNGGDCTGALLVPVAGSSHDANAGEARQATTIIANRLASHVSALR